MSEFSNNRENVGLIVARFDQHKDGNCEQYCIEDVIDAYGPSRNGVHHRVDNPLDHKPNREEIKSLEGMEADDLVGFEFPGGKHHYRRDPSDRRDLAKNRGGTRRQRIERVRTG